MDFFCYQAYALCIFHKGSSHYFAFELTELPSYLFENFPLLSAQNNHSLKQRACLFSLYVREGEHLSTVSFFSEVSFSEAHSLQSPLKSSIKGTLARFPPLLIHPQQNNEQDNQGIGHLKRALFSSGSLSSGKAFYLEA